jgi:hypothetical protein
MANKTKPKVAAKTAPKAKPVAEKKADPKAAKTAPAKVEEPARATPPDTVIVESTTLKPVEDDGGPNETYPFGIQFTTSKGFSYERFKTAKIRDKRLSVVGKSESVCAVKYTPPGGIPKPAAAPAPVAPTKPGPTLIKGGTGQIQEVNKRITPGAHIEEWRIARSVRVGKPGFFLQGGHYEKSNGHARFIVGEEEHFTDLRKAKEAKVAKLPPSDDPEVVPGKGARVN